MKSSYFLSFFLAIVILACNNSEAPVPSFEEQLKKDIVIVDDYLVSKNIKATIDPSGVRYLVTLEGQGEIPTATSKVYTTFKGNLLPSEQSFGDSKDTFGEVTLGTPFLLPCWQTVIPKLKKGSSVTIYSPSGLAYGTTSAGNGAVPANSNVIFEIRILDEVAQFKADTAAIKLYLKTKNILATEDASGVYYIVTQPGTGGKPIATSTVTFHYDGKLLATEVSFDKSTGTPLTLALTNIIKGLQIGFPLLQAGSKATFYIPSSLGYGPAGTSDGKIPSNSVLIFDVELVSFR